MLACSFACGPTPVEVLGSALSAVERGDEASLRRWVHPAYVDGLGGRDALLLDLGRILEAYPSRALRVTEPDREPPDSARLSLSVHLDVDLSGGAPSVRATGGLLVDFVRDGGFRIDGGFLTDLRDGLALASVRRDAVRTGRIDRLASTLHPSYRHEPGGGIDEALAALEAGLGDAVARVEPVALRFELRPDLVHLDEHVRTGRDDEIPEPATFRLTLLRTAGRLRVAAGPIAPWPAGK